MNEADLPRIYVSEANTIPADVSSTTLLFTSISAAIATSVAEIAKSVKVITIERGMAI